MTSLQETSTLLSESAFEVNRIVGGYYGEAELKVFGGTDFLQNTCKGVVETDYYTLKDCQILLDTSMSKGYSFQYRWLAQAIRDLVQTLGYEAPDFDAKKFFRGVNFLQVEYFCNFVLMQQFNRIFNIFFEEIGLIYNGYAYPNFVANLKCAL